MRGSLAAERGGTALRVRRRLARRLPEPELSAACKPAWKRLNSCRMSRSATQFVHGRIVPGDKVEVLSSEEGFSDAWATATVISKSSAGYLVEYNKFVDGDGKNLKEKVRSNSPRDAAGHASYRPLAPRVAGILHAQREYLGPPAWRSPGGAIFRLGASQI